MFDNFFYKVIGSLNAWQANQPFGLLFKLALKIIAKKKDLKASTA